FQIDQKLRLQLALDDRAGSNAAGHIAQHVIGGDQIVRDAAIVEPFAVPVKISVVRQARRDRRHSDSDAFGFALRPWWVRAEKEQRDQGIRTSPAMQRYRAHAASFCIATPPAAESSKLTIER